jgi:hypothetical protein
MSYNDLLELTPLTTAAPSGNIVTSFNTRTGDVVLTSSDVTVALSYTPAASGDLALEISRATNSENSLAQQITTLTNSASAYVSANSPAFSGTPTAPTAASGTNNTQLATTAFVKQAFSSNAPLTNAQIQYIARPGTQGFDPLSLFTWRFALSIALTAQADIYWMICGASAAAGVGSGNDPLGYTIANCANRGYVYQTAQMLNNWLQNISGKTNQYVRYGFCADGNATIFNSYGFGSSIANALNMADPRVTITGSTTTLQSQLAFGGNALLMVSPGDSISFKPTGFNGSALYTDNFIVVTEALPSGGNFSVTVNGSATNVSPTSISTSGKNAIIQNYISCKRATANTLKITNTTSLPIRVLAIMHFDSMIPAVQVLNGGISGCVLANWGYNETHKTTSSPYNLVAALLPSLLTLADFPVNDSAAGTASGSIVTDFNSLLKLGLTTVGASVNYLAPYTVSPSLASFAVQQANNQALINAAASATTVSPNGVPTTLGSYQIPYNLNLGFLNLDGEHPTYIGANSIAIGNFIGLTNLG